MKKILSITAVAVLLLLIGVSFAQQQGYIGFRQGAKKLTVYSGGTIAVESGGIFDVESGGYLKIAGTQVTGSAAELNYLDGTTLGTSVASKALGLGTTRNTNYLAIDDTLSTSSARVEITTGSTLDIESGGAFKIAGTQVTATAAALNGETTIYTLISDTTLTAAQCKNALWVARPLAAKYRITLAAAAAGLNPGFFVADADSLIITVAASDSMLDSAGAASVTTSSVAGTLQLVCIDAVRWVMQYTLGTWTSY